MVDQLEQIRSERLSRETKSLPAAHFTILAIFSIQLLVSLVYEIAQSPATSDDPILRLAFSFVTAVYLLVYIWFYMVLYGSIWFYMVIHGYTWLYMVIYGYIW